MQNDITVNSLVPLSLVLMTRTIINYSVANNVILVAVFCREKRAIRAYCKYASYHPAQRIGKIIKNSPPRAVSHLLGVFSACTSVTIRRPEANLVIKNVCIQENPKVWVSDFLPVLKEGFARHGIATIIYSESMKPAGCEYVLSYTALQSWHFVPYLSHAELSLEKEGRQIGYAEYHLIGKAGLSLTKWEGTKTKMDPVLDELLETVSNGVVGTAVNQKEPPGAVEGKPAIQESESKSGTQSKLSAPPASSPVKKFFANLNLYEGPIVGTNQITRAEFLETTTGSGSVRLMAPNNVLNGIFHSQPADGQKLTVLSSKTRSTIKLTNDSNTGFLSAKDEYGTRLECVYGTVALTRERGGVCEDTRGNKYKLIFD